MMRLFLLFFVMILGLGGCVSIEQADFKDAIAPPEDAHPSPIYYSGHSLKLPVGNEVGVIGTGGVFCGWPYVHLSRTDLRGIFDSRLMREVFSDTMEAQGYDVTGNLDFAFDDELQDDVLRSEYRIKANIVEVQIKACVENPLLFFGLFSSPGGVDGELYLRIKWSVFDNLRKRTVYQTETVGYTNRQRPNLEGLSLMIAESFEMAAHNLSADQPFYDLIFRGIKPDKKWTNDFINHEDRPRIHDPLEAVQLPAIPPHTHKVKNIFEQAQQITVLVQGGLGHGSGFFISKEGHILTNQHVIGDARRVRIVTSDKEDALIAEVLRTDRKRDVALLKLEDPSEMKFEPLPFQTVWPAVSETVYVIGAPRLIKLQDTVTKGIVSAHRKGFRQMGTTTDYIQADVSTHGGNSGGPLLDEYGNIAGMTVAGFDPTGLKNDAGLNLFIPIESAFDVFGIQIGADKQVEEERDDDAATQEPVSLQAPSSSASEGAVPDPD